MLPDSSVPKTIHDSLVDNELIVMFPVVQSKSHHVELVEQYWYYMHCSKGGENR